MQRRRNKMKRSNCNDYEVKPIGKFEAVDGSMRIRVYPEYRDAMTGLEDFAYVQVLWWFSRCDNKGSRSKQTEQKPYKKGSAILGTFATRAPERPNPIAVSTLFAASVDEENGIISLPYADAFPGTPVLDIKPYIPSLDRAESVRMPQWCAHWSASIEQSGDFDWASEFNF